MKTCPKCNSSLPDWAQQCQFCGTAVVAIIGRQPGEPVKKSNYAFGVAKWVWVVYYIISSWFVVSGLITVIASVVALVAFQSNHPGDNPLVRSFDVFFYMILALGVIGIIVGLGLIFQSEFIRGMANIYCCLMALGGIWSICMTTLGGGHIFYRIRAGMDLLFGVLMLYLIYETNDTSGF